MAAPGGAVAGCVGDAPGARKGATVANSGGEIETVGVGVNITFAGFGLGAAYDVAPGEEMMASLHLAEVDNTNATAVEVNNDGAAFVINNQFKF